MGFRFRKSFKIAPGIKVNFNKKSTGVTFGGKGFHYTVNSKGKKTASVGIPGSGLYYSSTSGGCSKNETKKSQGSTDVMESTNTKKWYQKTGFIILLLIFFFPVGLFLMWKHTNWSKNIKIAISAIIAVFFCISIFSSTDSDEPADTTVSDIAIESFRFLHSDALALEIGDIESNYFTVDGTANFSSDDIKLISSNEAVVTFTYDKTIADKYIYYNIEAIGTGTATVYVQTADGNVKSEEIKITVTGEEIVSKAPETTKQEETSANVPDTTKTEQTTNNSAITQATAPETTTAEKQTTTERETTTAKPAGRTVYITPKGKRYHYDPDCGGKNSYAVSIDNVFGRTPCQKCAR